MRCGWAGSEDEIGLGNRSACRAVDDNGFDSRASLGIDDLHAGAFRGKVAITPRKQGDQHRAEIEAASRRHVFVARRVLAVAAARKQAGINQSGEAPGQHIGSDAKALLELIKPSVPMEGITHDQHAPPFADTLQTAGDRARHAAQAFTFH